jgi:hypothetical protein
METDSDARVGSIAHILKTAFKNVYEDEKAEKDAIIAEAAARVLAAEQAVRLAELAAIAEAEILEKSKLDTKKVRKTSLTKAVAVPVMLDAEPTGVHLQRDVLIQHRCDVQTIMRKMFSAEQILKFLLSISFCCIAAL